MSFDFPPRPGQPAGSDEPWEPAPAPPEPDLEPNTQFVSGLLEAQRNAGFLRPSAVAARDDAFVSPALQRQVGLRAGDLVEAVATRGRRGWDVQHVWRVNGHGTDGLTQRPHFDQLTAIHPEHILALGPTPDAITGRLLDLIAPVGRGQRGLIVSPPKAGKTTILKKLAQAVAQDEDLTLLMCLVGERPEEVTDLRRSVEGAVLAADLDTPAEAQARIAELGVAHGKRLAEEGRHVVLLLDSLTRLARAHNLDARGGGRTLSGGLDAAALQPARQAFGAARTTEEAGSLTVLATALVDTGSRLDDVVYEEFKGTGNMEVHLDRGLAQQRLYPAVAIERSGTRKEEYLLDPDTLQQVHRLRRRLHGMGEAGALTLLLAALRKYPTNGEVLEALVS
ncbi:MAG: Transcription termination factor Rho [Anaerolineales bacterium]|nr:Transcription termination factor Rho [Anaerolineales bacterium]